MRVFGAVRGASPRSREADARRIFIFHFLCSRRCKEGAKTKCTAQHHEVTLVHSTVKKSHYMLVLECICPLHALLVSARGAVRPSISRTSYYDTTIINTVVVQPTAQQLLPKKCFRNKACAGIPHVVEEHNLCAMFALAKPSHRLRMPCTHLRYRTLFKMLTVVVVTRVQRKRNGTRVFIDGTREE